MIAQNSEKNQKKKKVLTEKQNMEWQLAFNAFEDMLFHKNLLMEKYAYEFQRMGDNGNQEKTATKCLRLSRQVISEINVIITASKSYLVSRQLQSVHTLISSMFKTMIASFNSISNQYLNTLTTKLRKVETKKNSPEKSCNENRSKQQNKKSLKQQTKQMEYFDYLIKSIEQQQNKICSEKHQIQQDLRQKQDHIATMCASNSVAQLSYLCHEMDNIIDKSNIVSGENIILRYQELTKRIRDIKKPLQLDNQFCVSIRDRTREIFVRSFARILQQYCLRGKEEGQKEAVERIEREKPEVLETAIQTQPDSKNKQIELLQKDKKYLLTENENILKMKVFLQNENQKMHEKFKEMKETIRGLQKKNEDLQGVIKTNSAEFAAEKMDLEEKIKKKQEQVVTLTEKVDKVEKQPISKSKKASVNIRQSMQKKIEMNNSKSGNQGNSVSLSNAQNISSQQYEKMCLFEGDDKIQNILREKAHISAVAQRELQMIKKQNVILRKCIRNIIAKLTSLGIIDDGKPTNTKSGKSQFLYEKLSSILDKLQCFFVNKTEPIFGQNQRISLRRTNSLEFDEIIKFQIQQWAKGSQKVERGTQTDTAKSGDNISVKSRRQKNSQPQNINNLEALKQKFLEKITKGHILNKYNKKSQEQNTQSQTMKTEGNQNDLSSSRSRIPYTLSILKKESTFEGIKIQENQLKQKKVSRFHQALNNIRDRKFIDDRSNMSASRREVLQELRPIVKMIETKNDTRSNTRECECRDAQVHAFVESMLSELVKIKGKDSISEMLRKQGNEYSHKKVRYESEKT